MSVERGVQRFSIFLAACAGAVVIILGVAGVLTDIFGGLETESLAGRVKLFIIVGLVLAPGLWAIVRGLVWVRAGFEGVDSRPSRKAG